MFRLLVFLLVLLSHDALREFRPWSTRSECQKAQDPNYPFAYNKYSTQDFENKARLNSNLQDFRHVCQVRGGKSKCHICTEDNPISCGSDTGTCFLQLQGVDVGAMSHNLASVTDTSWAVGGKFRKDFGGATVSHVCVFTSGLGFNPSTMERPECTSPQTNTFDGCSLRCFGYFGWLGTSLQCKEREIQTGTCKKAKPPRKLIAPNATLIDTYPGFGRWPDDGQVDLWAYPRNCTELLSQYSVQCTYSGAGLHTPNFNPQGFTFTVAGDGVPGFIDGTTKARFDAPQDLTVDDRGIVYVADTMNNAIRMVLPDGTVRTVAGKGPQQSGGVDGLCSAATFTEPKGIDVTNMLIKGVNTTVIIVADTGNHRIRRLDVVLGPAPTYALTPSKCIVKCLTGLCGNNSLSASQFKQKATPYAGYADGNGLEARFSAPEGLTISTSKAYVLVADTGNFLIRWVWINNGTTFTVAGRVVEGPKDASGNPQNGCPPPCMAGQSGYLDGNLSFSEFLNPFKITRGPNSNAFYIADDHRIRLLELAHVNSTIQRVVSMGRVSTVAGNAQQGMGDGLATEAEFFNPQGVFVTSDGSGYVVDQGSCRVRRITPISLIAPTVPWNESAVARVRPSGCTSVDQPYDKSGFKITRVEKTLQYNFGEPYENDVNHGRYIKNCVGVPPRDTLKKHFLNTTLSAVLSGLAVRGTVTSIGYWGGKSMLGVLVNPSYGTFSVGMIVSDLLHTTAIPVNTFVASIPSTSGQTVSLALTQNVSISVGDTILGFGDNLVVDDLRTSVNEDSEQGMAVTVYCSDVCSSLAAKILSRSSRTPAGSASAPYISKGSYLLEGNHYYSEGSSICIAAKHDNILPVCQGFVRVTFQRFDYLVLKRNPLNTTYPGPYELGKSAQIVYGNPATTLLYASKTMPKNTARVFTLEKRVISESFVHTVAGSASAPLQGGCGFADSQPSTMSLFNKPSGIAAKPGIALSNQNFLYIADTFNHRIRGISATCTQICENGGTCVGPDYCQCQPGWLGEDCTIPLCSKTCGSNKVCVGPDLCGCKPGYNGTACAQPLCTQECRNGGSCSAPDTCSCAPGWFDTNCTTPVCSQTCANGGDCISPNNCLCPSEWTGTDCRIPVCKQKCLNGGACVAPNTCACPPQYTNYDCSAPVCMQGFFVANSDPSASKYVGSSKTLFRETYRPCDLQTWCNYTKEFECDQTSIQYLTISVPTIKSITGRSVPPIACMNIEVPPLCLTPYELIMADGTTTGNRRHSPITPYESNPVNTERGYYTATSSLTGPWTYSSDRQIANVAWYNQSQGIYVCANGGSCTEPDVCQCAQGWIGFDCRTPVCNSGYYHPRQKQYVESQENTYERASSANPDQYLDAIEAELQRFSVFMQNFTNGTARHGYYTNPKFNITFEKFDSATYPKNVARETTVFKGTRYNSSLGFQGGYRCSIRAWTPWENLSYTIDSPNYYSQYMDEGVQVDGVTYTHWHGMQWPALNVKSRVLDQTVYNVRDADFPCDPNYGDFKPGSDQCYFDPKKDASVMDQIWFKKVRLLNITYANTNNGWRRRGIWSRTNNNWVYGRCFIEFYRNCSNGGSSTKENLARDKKMYDLNTKRYRVTVMDPDISYRPRISYDNLKVTHRGRWHTLGGECIDQVSRGCKNNGTCIAPNTCRCPDGWQGADCVTPVCKVPCQHRGNCTFPNTCTCERGWTGSDCSIPLCAQDCLNGGQCVAPDTCQCKQWQNVFRDGRLNGGRPLFQDEGGAPLMTGWTGFDCATPICVQSDAFNLNVRNSLKEWAQYSRQPTYVSSGVVPAGGHGGDTLLSCADASGKLQARCPDYNMYVSGNEGTTFQAGCGFDHFDIGCCEEDPSQQNFVLCYSCPANQRVQTNNTFYCQSSYTTIRSQASDLASLKSFLKDDANLRMCGRFHDPRYHMPNKLPEDRGIVRYYLDQFSFPPRPAYSNRNYLNVLTSNRFLCNIVNWEQGDYMDNAGLTISGVGSVWPLDAGRHIRVNYPNITGPDRNGLYYRGAKVRGEGIYVCKNSGSCLGPDICSCQDGYGGYDCNTPQCRHRYPSGEVTTKCANGGICSGNDLCDCVQVSSLLHSLYPQASAGMTGWTGSDCSVPMCAQGYYDPFCTDPVWAPAGQGCYRCANGGNCTAPDVCKCAPGWDGFDCRTPLCHVVADPLTRTQLATIFEDKVISFEDDPCGYEAQYGVRGWQGTKYARGNCTEPNVCTCLCKDQYNPKDCKKTGKRCNGPWQDPLVQFRNVLISRDAGLGYSGSWVFGSTDCYKGYEGNVNELDQFTTCHLTIYTPVYFERYTRELVVGIVVVAFLVAVIYYFVAARLRQRYLLAKVSFFYGSPVPAHFFRPFVSLSPSPCHTTD